MYFTSSKHPRGWYENQATDIIQQLLRRFDRIIEVEERGAPLADDRIANSPATKENFGQISLN